MWTRGLWQVPFLIASSQLLVAQTASSVSLSSVLNPAARSVTLVATVTPSDATGIVTFYDGARILGTSTMPAGRAVFIARQATGGARSFRACYSGDGADAACSALVTDSVAPAAGLVHGWSDSGAQTYGIDVAGAADTYTASFQTQYQLSSSALPALPGSVSPASGSFFDAESSVSVSAKGSAPYTFSHWSGAVSGSANPLSIGMSAPQAVTANFVSCDVNNDGTVDVADVQQIVNEALGAYPATHDLNGDGVVNVIDVEKLIRAVMGFLY